MKFPLSDAERHAQKPETVQNFLEASQVDPDWIQSIRICRDSDTAFILVIRLDGKRLAIFNAQIRGLRALYPMTSWPPLFLETGASSRILSSIIDDNPCIA